ncbi:MAG: hypothetical protein IJG69_03335 [Spirochaetales bacterium]|nr:hypothetical protein [Spirochaetales bacterium]
MIQFYLLSVVFLVLSAGLLLVDRYGTSFLFLINLKTFYNSKKAVKITFISLGLLIALAVIFFPVSPGPIILGDILPAANIVLVLIYLLRNFSKAESIADFNNGKRNALGFITLGVALIHFLFPWIGVV